LEVANAQGSADERGVVVAAFNYQHTTPLAAPELGVDKGRLEKSDGTMSDASCESAAQVT